MRFFVGMLLCFVACSAQGQGASFTVNDGELYAIWSLKYVGNGGFYNNTYQYVNGPAWVNGSSAVGWSAFNGYGGGQPNSFVWNRLRMSFTRHDTYFSVRLSGLVSGTGYFMNDPLGYVADSPPPYMSGGPVSSEFTGQDYRIWTNQSWHTFNGYKVSMRLVGAHARLPYSPDSVDPPDEPDPDLPGGDLFNFDQGDGYDYSYANGGGGNGDVFFAIPIGTLGGIVGAHGETTPDRVVTTNAEIKTKWYRESSLKPLVDSTMIGFSTLWAFLMPIKELRKGGGD